jgi:hypothetical protein
MAASTSVASGLRFAASISSPSLRMPEGFQTPALRHACHAAMAASVLPAPYSAAASTS